MATFKTCVFAHQRKADGTFNVKLRVTHHRKSRWIGTNLYAKTSDLTRGLRIRNERLLVLCQRLVSDCIDICNNMGFDIERMDVDELAAKLKAALSGEDRFRLDFMHYMEQSTKGMLPGTASGYRTALAALKRYVGRESLDISEITKPFIRGFISFIDQEPSQRGSNRKTDKEYVPQKKGSRAKSFYLSKIKTVYNKAKEEFNDEDLDLIKIKGNPFSGIKIGSQSVTKKRAVSIETIQKIIDLPPMKYPGWQMARDCFLLSFALMGMNSVDMLHSLPPKADEIHYERKKTSSRRSDNAEMRVRIEPCIRPLFEKYADKTGQRLFNFHLKYADRHTFTRMLNRGLKKVASEIGLDELTFYAARHSFATIARMPEKDGGAGIDKYMVHEMLNHVDKEMKVTDIYLVRNWRILFDANKKVLELFDWSALG